MVPRQHRDTAAPATATVLPRWRRCRSARQRHLRRNQTIQSDHACGSSRSTCRHGCSRNPQSDSVCDREPSFRSIQRRVQRELAEVFDAPMPHCCRALRTGSPVGTHRESGPGPPSTPPPAGVESVWRAVKAFRCRGSFERKPHTRLRTASGPPSAIIRGNAPLPGSAGSRTALLPVGCATQSNDGRTVRDRLEHVPPLRAIKRQALKPELQAREAQGS